MNVCWPMSVYGCLHFRKNLPGWKLPWTESVNTLCWIAVLLSKWVIFNVLYMVWVKKSPLKLSGIFFPNGWEFFVQILCTSYTFLSTLNHKFLFNYLPLWRSYTILSMTTQFTSYVQNVHQRPKRMLTFSDIFPNQLRIFSPNFTRLLHVPIYTRLQIFIQSSSTMTKLCHIKCDHTACISADGGHFEHMMVTALNMA